jgi:hypothetical protein
MQLANPGREISTEKNSELANFIAGTIKFITGEDRNAPAFAKELAKLRPSRSAVKR